MSDADAAFDLVCMGFFGLIWLLRHFLEEDGEEGDKLEPNNWEKGCSYGNCKSLTFRSTDYCWKHQDGKPHVTDGPAWWEEGGGVN
ncbi:MAG: hypothetical protein CMA88_04940 [Euryarchaeota archaeon]|nr:hypothetical protein [Euryarchaeota archaeon]|tara:strand:+ start:129 stop:386 length:258 start_codon:yes stop_codon:yes gene_type:complete